MNASSRQARKTIRNRTRTQRAATRITRRGNAAGRMRDSRRYTPAEVAQAAVIYKPRKPAYRDAAARLALAA